MRKLFFNEAIDAVGHIIHSQKSIDEVSALVKKLDINFIDLYEYIFNSIAECHRKNRHLSLNLDEELRFLEIFEHIDKRGFRDILTKPLYANPLTHAYTYTYKEIEEFDIRKDPSHFANPLHMISPFNGEPVMRRSSVLNYISHFKPDFLKYVIECGDAAFNDDLKKEVKEFGIIQEKRKI